MTLQVSRDVATKGGYCFRFPRRDALRAPSHIPSEAALLNRYLSISKCVFARACIFTSLVLVCASTAMSQRAVATSDLNVRTGQSTASRIVGHLQIGDTVSLVSSSPRKGYYHILTNGGTKGWAWTLRLQVVEDATTPAVSSPLAPIPSVSNESDTPANAVDASWTRTASNAADYRWPEGDRVICNAAGVGGDSETNIWKNREDSPTTYHEVTWDAIAHLDFPHNRLKHRSDWSAADKAAVAVDEGMPVSVIGFLSGIKVELPGERNGVQQKGESTNCGAFTTARVDWHIYLTKGQKQPHSQAIVVETTPRVRAQHSRWTPESIQRSVDAADTVRVSGWLMFDPEHFDQMYEYTPGDTASKGKARVTLWEIHPITKVEVRRDGQWVSLDAP